MSELTEHDKAILNCVFNPNLPFEENFELKSEELTDIEEPTADIVQSKKLEIEAVNLAERGDFIESLEIISKAIDIAPNKPSLYNNRAHIYQYLQQFEDALKDVTAAINICTEDHKKTLCQAYCQRGLLYRKKDENDLARSDFQNAANMGSKFAKSQLVELNPYAALCNQMLRQVMEKLK